jgi:hypothetical protein
MSVDTSHLTEVQAENLTIGKYLMVDDHHAIVINIAKAQFGDFLVARVEKSCIVGFLSICTTDFAVSMLRLIKARFFSLEGLS